MSNRISLLSLLSATVCVLSLSPISAFAQSSPWDGYSGFTRYQQPRPFVLDQQTGFGANDIVPVGHWREINRLPRDASIMQAQGSEQQSGQESGGSASSGGGSGDLAAQSQNPISSLVSVPLQSNWNFGIGPDQRTQYVGNLQPVVPVKLNEDWNLVNRVIVPFINTPIGPDSNTHGIGTITGQWFFTPSAPSEFTWGVGPAVVFPTASDPTLGLNEWQSGLNAVALVSKGKVVAGALFVQTWSAHGTSKPFLCQPFFNYNLPEGWFLNVSGECNADWEQPEDSRWSFPLGGGIGRVMPIFGQPMNLSVRFAPYLESPPGGPDWQFRFSAVWLFPKSS